MSKTNRMLPFPLALDRSVIQGTELWTCQGHVSVEAVIEKRWVKCIQLTVAPRGMAMVHGIGTGVSCETVNFLPATVIVPRRRFGPGFAATVYETWPLPVPTLPKTTRIHGTLLTAVQRQPGAVVTSAMLLGGPPAAPTN